MGIREVTGLLSAVGLSSPPAWLRPRQVLSNGEGFRADVARALAELDGLAVIDEFSSVVDRQVAKVASHAVQKHVRRAGRQLVAVTCHYDVTDWLQPDWAFDAASGEFSWRLVQRHPEIRLDVHPADRRLWPVFRRHHYLSSDLHQSARCFAAYAGGHPVAFASYMHFPHPAAKNIKVSHRVVVLPDSPAGPRDRGPDQRVVSASRCTSKGSGSARQPRTRRGSPITRGRRGGSAMPRRPPRAVTGAVRRDGSARHRATSAG